MLKRDLIKILESMPDDAVVVVNAGNNEMANGNHVAGVHMIKQQAFNSGYSELTWNIDYFPELEPDPAYSYRQAINIYS